jgi:hypothetical protein
MAFVIPEKMQKIYNELKRNYYPQPGDNFFFDLSSENYKPQRFPPDYEASDLIHKAYINKTPYAAIWYDDYDHHAPLIAFWGVSFCKTENLATGQILHFHVPRAIDLEKVKSELRFLTELLNSKVS